MAIQNYAMPAGNHCGKTGFMANFQFAILRAGLGAAMVFSLCGTADGHAESRSRQPQFVLINPIARPDSGVIIRAQNRAAKRRQPLRIEYDGVLLQNVAPLAPHENNEFCWRFRPRDFNLKSVSLREGRHSLRAGHPGQPLSEPLAIVWHTQPPLVRAEISKPIGSNKVAITGRVASKISIAGHPLSVQLIFDWAETALRISLPVQRRAADSAGFTIFTFRMAVQGLPKILAEEIDLAQPFFTLAVTDAAGNHFSQKENYAWFTAPGHKRMGAKFTPPRNQHNAIAAHRPRREIHIDLCAPPAPSQPPFSNQIALQLKAKKILQACQLKWSSLDNVARAEPVIAVVWREEEPVAICFTDQYRDEEGPPDRNLCYRLTQIERNGRIFSSNVACLETAPAAAEKARPLLVQAFGPGEASASTKKNTGRDETAIATVVGKHKPAIQDCYQRGLRRNYELKGKVVVRFLVTPQGTISEAKIVSSTLENSIVEDCMLDRIKRWNDFGAAAPEEGETAFKQTYLFGY